MAKQCPHPVREPRETGEITIGNEIATIRNYYCKVCGAFTHYAILSRRKKD